MDKQFEIHGSKIQTNIYICELYETVTNMVDGVTIKYSYGEKKKTHNKK